MTRPNLKAVKAHLAATLINAGESRSVVADETTEIASAMSILYGLIGEHPGRVTYAQACDVVMWSERNGVFRR
jgi:hypothetical protein